MTVYSIRTGQKVEDGESKATFTYARDSKDAVTFRFDGLELLDICIIRRILTEAEDDMLSPEPVQGPEPRAM